MTIATRNGAIIVKDGKLAEDCACCGGWYCCPSSSCLRDQISSVTVSITAQDYFVRYPETRPGTTWATYRAEGVRGSAISGTYNISGGAGNVFQLLAPSPELIELTVVLSPSTPCCDPVMWQLNIGWWIHRSMFSNVITPEQLWATPGLVAYKASVLSGTLSGCASPVSASASGSFDLWMDDLSLASVSISIT